MKRQARSILAVGAMLAFAACSWAQSPTVAIVDAINQSGGSVTVSQPAELDAITGHSAIRPRHGNQGFRVQIYYDMRQGKSHADYRKRVVEQELSYPAYVTFDSPYWIVRVGDFHSYSQASQAMQEIKTAFPSFADDVRVVRSTINTAK